MKKYHCPRCKVIFFKEKANMNERHNCGEFAVFDWGHDEHDGGGVDE